MPRFSTDREVLQTAIHWMEQEYKVALVTVIKTWGSSPRPVGSLMLIREDGLCCGSVSGGCVEEDLLHRYKNNQLSISYPGLVDYGTDHDETSRLGLPCGGRMELLIEELENVAQLRTILDRVQAGELITRQVCLHSGEVSLHKAQVTEQFSSDANYINKVFGPGWKMLIIGAGHLSEYVAQMALLLDYRVTVCDPREEYRNSWSVDGSEYTAIMPDDAVRSCTKQGNCIVLALSHDVKLDEMALMDALATDAFYVGAIGSKRHCEQRRKRLLQLGISEEQLNSLHAPVGLAIGSHTPAEIAVAILAEITALRNSAAFCEDQPGKKVILDKKTLTQQTAASAA